jgi:sec-independent protein translocase protein TatB
MFGDLNVEKLLVLAAVGLVVLGPERLPKLAADAGRLLRAVRRFAQSATSELREELGPEFADLDLADLHPRRLVQKHLFDDPDPVGSGPAAVACSPAATIPAAGPAGAPPFDAEAT